MGLWLARYNGDIECILGHLIPVNLTIIGIISLGICALFIYIAYTVIFVKFYRQKRRIKRIKNNPKQSLKSPHIGDLDHPDRNITIGNSSPGENKCFESANKTDHRTETFDKYSICKKTDSNSIDTRPSNKSFKVQMMRGLSRRRLILPGVNHILKSITAAKYILTTITVLSLTWLPWIATLYHDISTHHHHEISSPDNITTNHLFQECVHQLMESGLGICSHQFQQDQTFADNIAFAVHSFEQDFLQMFSIMVANTNSILNPIIYAFWYPDFRKTLKLQLRHIFVNP